MEQEGMGRCPFCGEGIIENGYCTACGRAVSATDAAMGVAQPSMDMFGPVEQEFAAVHHLPYHSVLKDRYLVEHVLGEGGFGITYAGVDQVLEHRVAIKEYFLAGHAMRNTTKSLEVYDLTYGKDSSFERGKQNFLKEARTMAKVGTDAALCGVIDFFEQNGTAYIIMDYVEGRSLAEVLEEHGQKMGFQELMALLTPIIDALSTMHASNLVHRDLSPDNIMVGKNGAVLIDFGCAREFVVDEGTSRTMTVMLKYDYAAPEQYGTGGQGPWTDVYGICAVLYRCLTGELAPRAPDRLAGEAVVPVRELANDVPAGAERTIMAGLSLLARDRPQSMEELKAGLLDSTKPKKPLVPLVVAGTVAVAIVGIVAFLVFAGLPQETTGTDASKTQTVSSEEDVAASDENAGSSDEDTGSSDEDARSKEAYGTDADDDGDQKETAGSTDAQSTSETSDSEDKAGAKAEGTKKTITVRYDRRTAFAAGGDFTVAVTDDGTVQAVGSDEYGQVDTKRLKGCVAVAAGIGHAVGLKDDGSVVAVGDVQYGQCKTGTWKNVTAVDAGMGHTVGLVADGTVVSAGNNEFGQRDVSGWKSIARVSAGIAHTLGLKSNGKVVAAGENGDGQCDVSDWRDIVAISAGGFFSAGLEADGTVVVCGKSDYGLRDVKNWPDVIAISAGAYHVVGLTNDGHVVAAGLNDNGQCDVSAWSDIVWVSAGSYHTVGLRSDGTLVATGLNDNGQCDVDGWKVQVEGEAA